MSEWKEYRFSDLVTIQRGHDLVQTKFKPGAFPVAGSNGIIGYHNQFKANGPGLTIGRSGNSIGVVHFYESNFWAHNTTLYTTSFQNSVPKFLYYFLKTVDFKSLNSGSAIPSLNRNHLYNMVFRVPSIPEQEAIAEILSSLDDKIDLLRHNNKTLEQLAETLFRQWFVEEADDSWETVRISDFYNVSRGLSYKGSGLCENFIPGCVMMLNLNSVYEGGGYKNNGVKYYNGEFRDRHMLYPGDLIITNTEQGHEHRLIGFGAIVPKTIGDNGIFSQHIYRVTSKNYTLSENYLYYLLKESNMREQMIGGTNGSTVNMLPINSVENAKMILPPENKLNKFEILAKDIQEKKENNQQQIQQLESLRDTLLPKLMSGEVKIKNLNL